jgi:hypothetical protein
LTTCARNVLALYEWGSERRAPWNCSTSPSKKN